MLDDNHLISGNLGKWQGPLWPLTTPKTMGFPRYAQGTNPPNPLAIDLKPPEGLESSSPLACCPCGELWYKDPIGETFNMIERDREINRRRRRYAKRKNLRKRLSKATTEQERTQIQAKIFRTYPKYTPEA